MLGRKPRRIDILTGISGVTFAEAERGMLCSSGMRDVQLKPSERKTLERLLARRSAHAGHIRRARVVLLSAEGVLARKFKLTSATVSKILRANGLKPHLVRTYKVSRDPEFAEKVKDIVGLYL